jgi:hypothetical protein
MAGATVVVVTMVEVVVVGEPADAVTGCETGGIDVVGVNRCELPVVVGDPPIKAATVPPTPARTTTTAIPATTIRRFMPACYVAPINRWPTRRQRFASSSLRSDLDGPMVLGTLVAARHGG